MRKSKAVVWDSQNKRLFYVFDAATVDKQGKITIAVNYKTKKSMGNTIRSAGLLNLAEIVDGKRYYILEGKI